MKNVIYALCCVLWPLNAQTAPCAPVLPAKSCHDLTPVLTQFATAYPTLAAVIQRSQQYKLQLIYTQVDRDSDNQPHLTTYTLGLNEQQYFYPASTVKLPIVLLALEWLNQQRNRAIKLDTPMLTDAAAAWQTAAHSDGSSSSGLPSIGHYIKKILLVSDNDASNRLYELLGQERINQRLHELGLLNSVINHRLSINLSEQQNRSYNPIRFQANTGELLLAIPPRQSETVYRNPAQPTIGKGYMADGQRIDAPMDFSAKNRLSLVDLDSIIKRIVFPQLFPASAQFAISAAQREFLLRYMAMLPAESVSPRYGRASYPDNYAKFFMLPVDEQSPPSSIHIFNKTGWAYGHLIDSAYIIDVEHGIEFFLSAVIYTNSNGILNDDQYETEQTGLPFMQQLGKLLYRYELQRHKSIRPDLTEISRILAAEL